MTKTELTTKIAELSAKEYCLEHNEGTYSAEEACRKVGCGDPHFANYILWESVDGKTRRQGPSRDRAPGRIRTSKDARIALKRDRELLASLRDALRRLER